MIPGTFDNSFNSSFLKYIIMTKQEIQASILTQIAGQGNQVDVGGALANILLAILDFAGTIGVSNITTLTADQLDQIQPGNIVIKNDETGGHAYVCTYKGPGGLCLTYADCDNVETVAYVKTEGAWAYDDTTVTHIGS